MPKCPQCDKVFVRRSHRAGPLEQLLSVFFIFPFRCQLCTHRFLAFQGLPPESRHREYERILARFPVSYHTTYGQDQIQGEGTAIGLSIRGCAFTTDKRLRAGAFLRLQLHATQGERPIAIDVAVVRSTVKTRVGLEFLTIRDEEDQRLRRVIETLLRGKTLRHQAHSSQAVI
jgi:hypothetical protein